ncbi:arginine--tRNA ligase [Candidatus Woesebacteria bacterium]|nr:arginine--tRNA ligase [Candidatus Woesebacteria bacterium]
MKNVNSVTQDSVEGKKIPNATETIENLVRNCLKKLNLPEELPVALETPADSSHGDYATTIPLRLFSQVEDVRSLYKNPRELAGVIVNELQQTQHFVLATCSVAGPGFINFCLSEQFLLAEIGRMVQNQFQLPPGKNKGKKVVVEYSSPNIAKPFTIGHLRSTIIGDAVANLLEAVGHTVYRDNHLGDWGTQFGKQIYAIKTWGDEDKIQQSENPVKELVELYIRFHAEAEENPEIEEEGRAWFKKLETGDLEARRLWGKCIEWSWKEFEQIYERLDVHFTENGGRGYGESFFEDGIAGVLTELQEKGMVKESDQALLIFFPEDKYPPLMVMKKDGATLYSTRDLATDRFRLEKYGSDIIVINEVGIEQSLYFKQLYAAEQLLGWYQPEQRVHVAHGHYRFKDKKMSTRKGNVIWLEEVLQSAFERVKTTAQKRISDENIWKIAIGALKWNDLKRSAQLDVTFDWDELLQLQGNSGPYLQYSFVRCRGVLRKILADIHDSQVDLSRYISIYSDMYKDISIGIDWEVSAEEKDLLLHLYRYFDAVSQAAENFAPHHLSLYLYKLAQSFNAFYARHPIAVGYNQESPSAVQQARVLMTLATSMVLKDGLALLGIAVVDTM